MSTVFTGESKIFQLAGIDFEAKSSSIPNIERNTPVICKMMDVGFEMVRQTTVGDVPAKQIMQTVMDLYQTVDEVTNIFLEEMERAGFTWPEIHAKWLSYQASLQNSCAQDLQVRISKLN